MNADDNEKRRFYLYCLIALIATCIIIAYFLYWFIKKCRMNGKSTRIRIRSKLSKSTMKSKKKKSKEDVEYLKSKKSGIDKKKLGEDYSSTSSSSGTRKKSQDEQQDTVKTDKVSNKIKPSIKEQSDKIDLPMKEQSIEYNNEIEKKGMVKQEKNEQQQQNESTISQQKSGVGQQQQQIPTIKISNQKQTTMQILEPNRYLKEVCINPLEEEVDRVRLLGSKQIADTKSILNKNKKIDSSVIAYSTSPISVETSNQDTDSMVFNNLPSNMSKVSEDPNKNATSILSIANTPSTANTASKLSDSSIAVNQSSQLNQFASFIPSKDDQSITQTSSKLTKDTTNQISSKTVMKEEQKELKKSDREIKKK